MVADVVSSVASSAVKLTGDAETLLQVANETRQGPGGGAHGERASTSVQTIAGSAEEMTTSIGTISRRVSDATQRAADAAA